MRVALTGATGFVGGHTLAALHAAGHDVVVLARDRTRLVEMAESFGIPLPRVVVGDMTDPIAVTALLEDADAVIHAAAFVSLNPRDQAEMAANNLRGVELVVGGAVQRELDPVIVVSSTSAVFRPGGGVLHSGLPLVDQGTGYARSKADCEAVARRLQGSGAPVVIVSPASIIGPAAGTVPGELAEGLARFLAYRIIPTRHGAVSLLDVRDLAAVLVALVEPGRGPREVMFGGRFTTLPDMTVVLRELTNKRFVTLPLPGRWWVTAGRLMDRLSLRFPIRVPVTEEAMQLLTHWEGSESSGVAELGVMPRSVRASLADSLESWARIGLVTERRSGQPSTPAASGSALAKASRGVKAPVRILTSPLFRRFAPKVLPRLHRFLLHATGGRTMFDSAGQPMLMLITTGAKSGLPREAPMAAVPRPDGRLMVVGSNFARDTHPAWTGNLLANPRAEVIQHGRRFAVDSRLLSEEERLEIWPELLAWFPNWSAYEKITDRTFRVFELTPLDAA
jgi:deazaflavin-dependent oxidoreductase (nitroreductase family)